MLELPSPIKALLAIALLASAISSSGCVTGVGDYFHNGFKVGPNYAPPAAPLADEWIDSRDPRVSVDCVDHGQWWQVFQDPVLDRLIVRSYSQNLTLREAGLRVMESQAQRSIAVGNLLPQSQQATGGYTRSIRSLSTGGITTAVPVSAFPRYATLWSLGGQAAWELDFWGRFRRSIEASDARLDASIENYDDVLVILLAEVASTYVEIRTVEQRLAYARQNLTIQRESTRIADARKRADAPGNAIDAPQAHASLSQTEAGIEQLAIALRQAQNRLAVLLGMPPHDLAYLLGPAKAIPQAPESVALNVPGALMQRRPDLRRAEREVAAQSAEIGIAESDLYPQISVNGNFSFDASRIENLLDSRALAGAIGPQFRWNVLNYGRLRNNVRVQDARFQQLVARYQQAALEANEEAENALVAYLRYHRQVRVLAQGELAALEAVRVATTQFEEDFIDYNRLFTVQQFLVTQQDQLATARGNLASSLIQLYRAMGGGWEIRLGPPPTVQPPMPIEPNGPELLPLAPPADRPAPVENLP